MTFAATDVRFRDAPMHLLAVGADLHTPLKQRRDGSRYRAAQLQELAGIGLQHARHRACPAEIARPTLPGGLQETAFFRITASEVVAIEILTFFSSRCMHVSNAQTEIAGGEN